MKRMMLTLLLRSLAIFAFLHAASCLAMPPERSVHPTQIAQQKLNYTNIVYFVNWLVGLLVEEAWF